MSTTEMEIASTSRAGARSAELRPYRRSWVDALIELIERLPGPAWFNYPLFAALGIVAGVGILGTDSLPESPVYRLQVPISFLLAAGSLALIRYLNGVAGDRLDQFAPVLGADRASVERLRYEMTVLPARPAIVASILGIVIVSLSYQADTAAAEYARLPLTTQAVGGLTELFLMGIWSALVYHTIRQLRMVDRIHAQARTVDLFNPAPLHAFSGLTARTGAGLILAAAALLSYPDAYRYFSTWVVVGVLVASGIAAFVLPLRGMQRRLAAEKGRLVEAANQRMRTTLERLDRQVDGSDLSGADALNKTLASQVLQRDILARLPTWPWSTGTLRGFISVLVVPLVLWAIQRFLNDLI